MTLASFPRPGIHNQLPTRFGRVTEIEDAGRSLHVGTSSNAVQPSSDATRRWRIGHDCCVSFRTRAMTGIEFVFILINGSN